MTHFPDDNQVFHLRTTEPDANTLFIEELQSDWNNAISKKGIKKGTEPTLNNELTALEAEQKAILDKYGLENTHFQTGDFQQLRHSISLVDDAKYKQVTGQDIRNNHAAFDNILKEDHNKLFKVTADIFNKKEAIRIEGERVPKSPLPNDKWISVGLRKAIAMAIENGQTRVEWTTSAQQVSQWGKGTDGNFEKMYINLYDKKMPSIAKRIANKYNSRAALHYIIINDEMIKHHKSGKGSKLRAAAPVGLTASEAVKEKEDKS